MSVSAMGHDGFSLTDRDPHIHSTSDLISEKLNFVLMKQVASLVEMFRFSEIFSDNFL